MTLPDSLIIGAIKADTTSLYHDLLQNLTIAFVVVFTPVQIQCTVAA